MERTYKYFIENEKGEWYYFDPNVSLEFHVDSSDRNYRCQCWKCRGEQNYSGLVTDPLVATAYPDRENAERLLKVLRGKQFTIIWQRKPIYFSFGMNLPVL